LFARACVLICALTHFRRVRKTKVGSDAKRAFFVCGICRVRSHISDVSGKQKYALTRFLCVASILELRLGFLFADAQVAHLWDPRIASESEDGQARDVERREADELCWEARQRVRVELDRATLSTLGLNVTAFLHNLPQKRTVRGLRHGGARA
jgi:hypothetical protein